VVAETDLSGEFDPGSE